MIHRGYNNHWKKIAKHFNGRTDNIVKNQFFAILRKYFRKMFKLFFQEEKLILINEIKPKILSEFLLCAISIQNDLLKKEHFKLETIRDLIEAFLLKKMTNVETEIHPLQIELIKSHLLNLRIIKFNN